MNALTFSGVFLLLFFSLSSADICTNVSDTNSKVFQCNAEFSQRSSTACEGNCRSELEQYADDCLGNGTQAYKDSITAVCGGNSICTDIGNTNSKVYRCNLELAERSSSACEGNCRSELEQYADDCLGNGTQAYKDSITAVCGGNSICTDIGNTNSKVYRCNLELAERSSSACEGNCRSEQEQYADDCLGDSAQVYKDAITAVCGEGSSAAGIGSTTLLTTVSALLFAVYTAFM
jgi:hypothetical protein